MQPMLREINMNLYIDVFTHLYNFQTQLISMFYVILQLNPPVSQLVPLNPGMQLHV